MDDLARAVAVLRRGGLVGMPTETVYGLAADATDPAAVVRIFEAKGRPSFDPLIVHVADRAGAAAVAVVDEVAALLMERFWPGPLTLVLPRRAVIPDVVTSGLDTVGVRCPDHPLALTLIRGCGRPLAAPSANRFGRLSPTSAEAVREQLGSAVEVVLDGGPCRVGVESTVLLIGPEPVVLRPGGVPIEALVAVLGRPVAVAAPAQHAAHLPPQAPGMLAQHYAPRTPVRLKRADVPWPTAQDCARLAWTGVGLPPGGPTEVLSPAGDPVQAAQQLFAALRRLDAAGAALIVAELVPDAGLGLAINDRLRRAAASRV